MKKVITILIIIVAIFSAVAIHGQVPLDEKFIKTSIETNQLVFEGEIVNSKRILYQQDKDYDMGTVFLLYLIKPTAVFKGQTDSTKRYEILLRWGSYTNSSLGSFTTPDQNRVIVPKNGIFFFGKEIKQPDYCEPYNNAIDRFFTWSINYQSYPREDVLNFFDEKYNLKPTIFEVPVLEKKSPNNIKVNHQGYFSNHDTLNSVRQSKHIANDNISFEFNNFNQSGIGPVYFEFDIMAIGADTLSFFDHNNSFAFNYSNAAFGDSIVSNHHVTITKALPFDDTTYYDPNSLASDFNANTIVVPFGVDLSLSSWNRTRIEITPIPILHFKIEVQDCSQSVNIFFNGAPIGISYYTHNADDYPTLDTAYNSGYLNNIGGLYCVNVPYIDSFTNVVYPGSYFKNIPYNTAKMVIYGNNFGAVKDSNCTVFFKSADDGGASYVPLNLSDIPDSNWTNTKITFNVPSIIDSFPGLDSTQWTHPCPGSGIFYVQTNTLQKAWSTNIPDSIVTFPYAIINTIANMPTWSPPYRKLRCDIANQDNAGGYLFHLDSTVIINPDTMFKPCILYAEHDWRCNTQIPYDGIGGNVVNVNFNNYPYLSAIFTVPMFPGSPLTLAETRPYIQYCVTSTDTIPFFFSIKIAFLNDPSIIPQLNGFKWQCDTLLLIDSIKPLKLDFLETSIHEFGHGDGLNHVNQKNQIMYSTGSYGPIPPNLRKQITSDDQNGGRNVVIKSASDIWLPCSNLTYGTTIPALHCSGSSSFITEINSNVISFKVYPNPISNDLLNIEYELKKDAPVNFILLDNMGKEVYKINENQTSGKHIDKMNLQSLSTGLYYLEVIINDKGDTQPIIKVR